MSTRTNPAERSVHGRPTAQRNESLWPRLKWGWGWAFYMATIFSLWVLFVADTSQAAMSPWGICAVYFTEASVAGVILGLLRPFATWSRWGAAVAGFLVAGVGYGGFVVVDPELSSSGWMIGTMLMVSLLGGGGMGIVVHDEAYDRSESEELSPFRRFIREHQLKIFALMALLLIVFAYHL